MKPSERKARIKELADTPGLNLSPAERKQYLNKEQQAACVSAEAEMQEIQSERAEDIERVAAKIRKLREHMVSNGRGKEFGRFRFCCDKPPVTPNDDEDFSPSAFQLDGWPREGGVYHQPEDDREAFVDLMLKKEGLA